MSAPLLYIELNIGDKIKVKDDAGTSWDGLTGEVRDMYPFTALLRFEEIKGLVALEYDKLEKVK